MRPDPVYPSALNSMTFADGIEYQDWICTLMASQHIILQNLSSKKYQYEVGENLQGFEIKLDRRCTETRQLSIEVAEKSEASNAFWVPSGIFREDNSWLYIQGNYERVWVFSKKWLKRWYWQKVTPENSDSDPCPDNISESYGTVRKFYIPILEADEYAVKVLEPTAVAA